MFGIQGTAVLRKSFLQSNIRHQQNENSKYFSQNVNDQNDNNLKKEKSKYIRIFFHNFVFFV